MIAVEDFFPAQLGVRLSEMANNLEGSRILAIAADIRQMQADGKTVYNFTVGDFKPSEFPIPEFLRDAVVEEYHKGQTNYPPAAGMPELRLAIRLFYQNWMELEYPIESIVAASGARPIIYAAFRTLVNPGDKVLYPVPSWNNHYYIHLNQAVGVPVACCEENDFLLSAESIKPLVRDARMLVLNTPLNPTGTAFTRETLSEIADLVLEENRRRGSSERPLYLLFDKIYWMLVFDGTLSWHPVQLCPELAPYVISVDGISKAFAATGLRVGWGVGPPDIIAKMSPLIGHMGAWGSKPAQLATAAWLQATEKLKTFHGNMVSSVESRLSALYHGIRTLEQEGLPISAIQPMGAIYLSVKINVYGKTMPDGSDLNSDENIRSYLLEHASLAAVPFRAFGFDGAPGWFRFSIGAVSLEDISSALGKLRTALQNLK